MMNQFMRSSSQARLAVHHDYIDPRPHIETVRCVLAQRLRVWYVTELASEKIHLQPTFLADFKILVAEIIVKSLKKLLVELLRGTV